MFFAGLIPSYLALLAFLVLGFKFLVQQVD